MKKVWNIGLREAKQQAKTIAQALQGGEILALSGPLGSGKTTFTQSLGKALGVKNKILSPTFVLMNEFKTKLLTANKKPVWLLHLDLYRTENIEEVQTLGLTELWGKPNIITVIEWAEKIKKYLPKNTIRIKLSREN